MGRRRSLPQQQCPHDSMDDRWLKKHRFHQSRLVETVPGGQRSRQSHEAAPAKTLPANKKIGIETPVRQGKASQSPVLQRLRTSGRLRHSYPGIIFLHTEHHTDPADHQLLQDIDLLLMGNILGSNSPEKA